MLILETFGINVWCAAGKGSFGTSELVNRIQQTELAKVVQHRSLQLPILGAPGVAAHEIIKQTGFRVCYATIRAADLPEYLDNGQTTTPAMRELTFSLRERLVLVPVETVLSLKSALPLFILLFVAGWLANGLVAGLMGCVGLLGAILAGTVMAPLLLPWLPGTSFAVKGVFVGLCWSLVWLLLAGQGFNTLETVGMVLAFTAASAFCAFNFTGCTPFTSPSGVRKELRIALPVMAVSFLGAVFLWGWTIFL